jgi:hypothetical protein
MTDEIQHGGGAGQREKRSRMGQPHAVNAKGTGIPTAARNEQLNMLGAEPGAPHVGPVARSSDPSTSHTAAKKAARGLSTKQLAVLDTIQRARSARVGMRDVEMTHDEIIDRYRLYRQDSRACLWYPSLGESSIRTRVSELVTLRYVDKHDENGRSLAGNPAARWTLTEKGKRADVATMRFDADRRTQSAANRHARS